MHLKVFNGSPRGKQSNSKILMDQFLAGFMHNPANTNEVFYLASTRRKEEYPEIFSSFEHVIIIFPLYTDSMPYIVKDFLENLFLRRDSERVHVGFIVQSGFPESKHSTFVTRYLKKISEKMHWNYDGTIIKGGIEGIQIMPPLMTKKLFNRFFRLGKYYGESGTFHDSTKDKLMKPYEFSLNRRTMFWFMQKFGFTNYYWNKMLKDNKAFDKRFDKPYNQI